MNKGHENLTMHCGITSATDVTMDYVQRKKKNDDSDNDGVVKYLRF